MAETTQQTDPNAGLELTYEDTNTSYLQFIEGRGAKGVDMLSPDGLQLQADYLKELADNQHPLDIARRLSLNPFAVPRDRLAACKLLLEYTARKIPAQMELTGRSGGPINIGAENLKNLTTGELDKLLSLLDKANGAPV